MKLCQRTAPAFGGCEATLASLVAFARAPDEKLAIADGAKNFTLPESGADLKVFSLVSEGFAEGVETGSVGGGDVEEVVHELSVGSFLDTGEMTESPGDLLTDVCTIGAFEGDFLTGVTRGFLLFRRSTSRDRELP